MENQNEDQNKCLDGKGCGNCKHGHHAVIGAVLVMVMVALGAYTYNTIKETNYFSTETATITVSGEGEELAKPDIATFSFAVLAEAGDASAAQEESAKAVNEILAFLEEEGVAEKDIKTQYYNLNPRYDYVRSVCTDDGFCPPGERVLRGYTVSQSVLVKVRDIENAGALISGVGTRGATNVSSLQFTIDDEDEYVAKAREKAIDDAKVKAKKLADDLGVSIVRIVSFNENGGDNRYYGGMKMESMAMDSSEDFAIEPEIPTGENTFTSSVSITYEVQ